MNGNSGVGPILMLAALSWFGRLPGDVRVERPGFSLYAPITSMILVSLALSAALAAFRWFGRG
jgi:hypothetical protein